MVRIAGRIRTTAEGGLRGAPWPAELVPRIDVEVSVRHDVRVQVQAPEGPLAHMAVVSGLALSLTVTDSILCLELYTPQTYLAICKLSKQAVCSKNGKQNYVIHEVDVRI